MPLTTRPCVPSCAGVSRASGKTVGPLAVTSRTATPPNEREAWLLGERSHGDLAGHAH